MGAAAVFAGAGDAGIVAGAGGFSWVATAAGWLNGVAVMAACSVPRGESTNHPPPAIAATATSAIAIPRTGIRRAGGSASIAAGAASSASPSDAARLDTGPSKAT